MSENQLFFVTFRSLEWAGHRVSWVGGGRELEGKGGKVDKRRSESRREGREKE